jgi:hypothetical protein
MTEAPVLIAHARPAGGSVKHPGRLSLATRSSRLGSQMLDKVPLWAPALVLGALISIGLEELGASGQVVFFADVALVLIYCAVVDLYRR